MYTQYPFPIRPIQPSPSRERWAARKTEILMARVRSAARACLQIPQDQVDKMLPIFGCEWVSLLSFNILQVCTVTTGKEPLVAHIGYCTLQGFSFPRYPWLVDSAQAVHGATSDRVRLFTLVELNQDGTEAHDAEVLRRVPALKHWWTSFPFKNPPSHEELHLHIDNYLSKVRELCSYNHVIKCSIF